LVKKDAVRKVLCKFASPVLGSSTPRFLSQIEHWLNHKGVEWVSDRLKATYQASIQLKSGNEDGAKEILAGARISARKDIPVPRGPLGSAALAFVKSQRPAVMKRASALLRSYTAMKLRRATTKQIEKARLDITGEPKATSRGLEAARILVSRKIPIFKPGDAYTQVIQNNLYRLDASRLSGVSRYYCGKFSNHPALKDKPFSSAALSSMVVGEVPRSAVSILGDLTLRKEAEEFQGYSNLPGYGKISFLQEGGCKARVVCQPSFWCQVYFRPASDQLFEVIRSLERNQKGQHVLSCVLDQNTGAYLLEKWLKEGRKLFSVDLSAATDRFPLEPQLQYLKGIGMEKWSGAFKELSEGKFYVPQTKQFWSYSVGQPMGIAGSFPLFHLTHHAILTGLCKHLKFPPEPQACVLGDDVLIADERLDKAYRSLLVQLGVEVSKVKSSRGSVQSFAGFHGVATDKGVTVFRPFKHGQDFAMNGKEVNLLSTMGSEVRKWSKWWSETLDRFLPTVPLRAPDLSPLLPDLENQKGNWSSTGSRWFGSLCNQILSDLDYKDPSLMIGDRVMGSWNRERDTLFSRQGPNELVPFEPEEYKQFERLRKKSFNQVALDAYLAPGASRVDLYQSLRSVSKSTGLTR